MRQVFTSRASTILTMVGVAVGLGNVWRFPYMMGRFGGSAFLITYVICVLAFALPALMGEWALGRETRSGPLGAFDVAFGRWGRAVGVILLTTVLVANSYYVVVVANVTYTAAFSLGVGFAPDTIATFQSGLDNGVLQAGIALLLIASALWVIGKGLNRGIERISRIFVPFFGIVVLYLIIATMMLPGATDQILRFLQPRWSDLTPTSVFAAMGQAFFSLSLGGTFYLIYGSYLRDDEVIPSSAAWTAGGDVAAALLAALFIVPATLVFGLDLETGPRLIFVTLPELFARIPGGRLLGTLFVVALGFVAYLSSVAAFQVLVGTMQDHLTMRLRNILLIVGIAESILMLPSALRPSLIGTLDLIFGSGMQVLGSGLTLVALTWGMGRLTTQQQVFRRTTGVVPASYYLWVKWIVPLGLALVLALYIIDSV
jgi:neurotransmitter:Na+ symporter, NSS family